MGSGPKWKEGLDWNDSDNLKAARKRLQERIRARDTSRGNNIEEDIVHSGELTKRIRELEPPLVVPVERDDGSTRYHEFAVYERAVTSARRRVHIAASAASTDDQAPHNIAVETLRRLDKGRRAHPDAPPHLRRDKVVLRDLKEPTKH